MEWQVTSKQSEDEWLDDYVREVLATRAPDLPAHEQRIGRSLAGWHETESGIARIYATEGNPDDRAFALWVLQAQLKSAGFSIAQYDLEWDHDDQELIKEAAWDDVEAKAKRLVQTGKVQILRNGYNNIVAQVQGDHGSYQVEIGRDDPNSQSITTWQCFLPDAPVTMADGTRKAISEIAVGDRVISHTGNIRKVTAAWARPYEGDLTRIRLSGMDEEIVATSNHSFWSANYDYYRQQLVGWRGKNAQPEVVWREIGTLAVDDYLSMTPVVGEEKLEINGIEIDKDMAYLLGWYTAEGYTIKSTANRIGFSLHWEEWPVAEKLSEICERKFGTAGTIRRSEWKNEDRHWMTDFRVSSSNLRAIVEELIGTGAHTKKLDERLLVLPLEIQVEFLRGWFEGDGNYDDHGRRSNLFTVSHDLAMQARHIIGRLGYDSALSWNDDNSGNGFVKNWRRIYRVRWNENRTRFDKFRFFKDGSVWHKIINVEHEFYNGLVYDIEVEIDHSFQAYGVNCHNCECPWDQFAWNRTRQWKKYEGRVCAHTLAAFWAARSTPIDEEYSPAGQGVSPFGTPNPAGQTPGMAPGTVPPITPGRTFMPDNSQPQPTGQPQDLIPPYPMDPTMMPQVNPVSVPGLKPQTPLNPVQYGGGTFSSVQGWQFSPDPDTIWVVAGPTGFENGAMVSTKHDEVGTWIGKSEAHGAGSYTTIPAGSVGECLGQDPTGLVNVLFMNKALGVQEFGELMPYGATAWFWPSDLVQRTDIKPPGPAVRRR